MLKHIIRNIFLVFCFLTVFYEKNAAQITPGTVGVMTPASSSCSPSFLAMTCAYLESDAALLALDSAEQAGIDRWFRDINGQANGSYTTYDMTSKLFAVYLMIGGTSTSVAVNAINPGTYNLVHTNSPTITTNGIAYTGTSGAGQYSSTQFTPLNSRNTQDMICHGIHRRDANNDLDASVGVTSSGASWHLIRSDNFRSARVASRAPAGSAGTLTVASLWMASYSDTATLNYYDDGTKIQTLSVPGEEMGFCGDLPYLIGACNASTKIYGGVSNTVDHVVLGKGYWSDAEQTFWYNAFNALQTVLGR